MLIHRGFAAFQRVSPELATFIASLFLSLIAYIGGTINRDGVLYIRTAQAFIDGGIASAWETFSWPFFPIGIAIFSKITGLGLELAGYVINAIAMAGTCALIVASVRQSRPELSWIAALIVLAIPGINEYRNELLREYGYWFFASLAFWLATKWADRPQLKFAIGIQAAIIAGALFRPEALALFLAVFCWWLFSRGSDDRLFRFATLFGLPLICGALLAVSYWGEFIPASSKLAEGLRRFSPSGFSRKAEYLASGLDVQARDHAMSILLMGSLALVPLKLVSKAGVFSIPLLLSVMSARNRRTSFRSYPLFAWGIATQIFILATFAINQQYLAGRWLGLSLLFSVPFVALGCQIAFRRHPHLRIAAFCAILVLVVSNVVSTGSGKKHYVEAGLWLAANYSESSNVYIDSGRVAYHAGWLHIRVAEHGAKHLENAIESGKYSLFVLQISKRDDSTDNLIKQRNMTVIQRFERPSQDTIIVATFPSKKAVQPTRE